MILSEQIRGALRAYLEANHISPSALADREGLGRNTILRWLNSPDAETIRASNFARIEPLIRPYLPAAPASAPGAHSQNTNGHGSVQVNGNGNTVVLAHRIDETEKAILSDDSIPADAKVRLIRKLKGMGGFVVFSSFLYGFLCLAAPLGMWAATAAQPPGVRLLATAERVTQAVAEQYLNSMRAKAPRTANLARGVLSHVWKTVGLPDPWGQCRTRPRKTIPFRPLTDDEVSCALAEAAKVAPWWRPLILVGFYTGLRSRLAAVSSCEMGLVMALKNAVNGLRP